MNHEKANEELAGANLRLIIENDGLRAQTNFLIEENRQLREALRPFARFAEQWARQPIRSIDDEFYGIHTGTEYEASLRISDCEKARAVFAIVNAPERETETRTIR